MILKIWFDKNGPSTKAPDLVLKNVEAAPVQGGIIQLSKPVVEGGPEPYTDYKVVSVKQRFNLQAGNDEPSFKEFFIVVLEKL
jgi:hypothetical protein